MVHHQELRTAGQPEPDRILQAGQSRLCRVNSYVVCKALTIGNPSLTSVRNSVLFFVYVIFTLITLYPSKSFRAARSSMISDKEANHQPYDMLEMPQTPGGFKDPTTPRTTAFNTLSRNGKQPMRQGNKGIPLRHHIGMGDETYQGPSAR